MRDPGPPVRLRSPHGSDPELQDPLQPDRRTVYGTNTQDGHGIPVPTFQAPAQRDAARARRARNPRRGGLDRAPGRGLSPTEPGSRPGYRGGEGSPRRGLTRSLTHRDGQVAGTARRAQRAETGGRPGNRGRRGRSPRQGLRRSLRDGPPHTHRDRQAAGDPKGRKVPRRLVGGKPGGAGAEPPLGVWGEAPGTGPSPTETGRRPVIRRAQDADAAGRPESRGCRGRSPRWGLGRSPRGGATHPPSRVSGWAQPGRSPRKKGAWGSSPRPTLVRGGGAPPAAPPTAPAPTASAHRETRVPSVPPLRRPRPPPAG